MTSHDDKKPCRCGKMMILRSSGIVYLTSPAQHPMQWWCGGCGEIEAGPTIVDETAEQAQQRRWREAQDDQL